MKKHITDFLKRGLIFGGFGPIVLATVYLIISVAKGGLALGAKEIFLGVISTYLLAFLHAGSSIFNQMESLSIAKRLLIQLGILYVAYTLCYLINSWLPFKWSVLLIYTAAFTVGYTVIWLSVLLSVKAASKRLNKMLDNG